MTETAGNDVMLRVEDLSRKFGELTAVAGLSFAVRRGEIFGFLGPNGAGKTTTIKMMCGLLRPHGGVIEIAGRKMSEGDWKGLRRIGVCPQHIVIWEAMTCFEQLEFMGRMYDLDRRQAGKRASELLATFGLAEKRNKLARTLSGGMQRRLNIALALVHEPELLFLDEPQAGLDPQSRVLVRDYIQSLAGKMTIVLTTHDMEEAEKLSDRVCIIDKGRLLVLDSVAGIKNRLGQGDLFEIRIAEDPNRELLPQLSAVKEMTGQFTIRDNTVSLVSETAADVLPLILQRIKEKGLHLEDLRIRKTTLEDVFIRLTGRGLRE
jgi:ABC-2 type transport system ATP-binding protein